MTNLAKKTASLNSIDKRIQAAVGSFFETIDSGADLALHRDVEETVNELVRIRRFMDGAIGSGRVIVEAIRHAEIRPGHLIDSDGALYDQLGDLVDRFEKELTRLTAKKGCIDSDNSLNESHCDMLHSSYDDVLVSIACLIEVTRDMRETMASHDIEAEPRGKAFVTSAELLHSLN